jgi:D-alanyl-D-alanine carboxypeptidase
MTSGQAIGYQLLNSVGVSALVGTRVYNGLIPETVTTLPAINYQIISAPNTDTNCEPTKIYVKPGQSYTRRELLNALLVKSGNDVARTLARDNAGSVSAFADKMTQRVRSLGGSNSNFENPNGLPAKGQ